MSGTNNRCFASMDSQKQREIASKGGKAAHQKGTAHQFTSEEARRAGSKGGRAARQRRTAAKQAGQPGEQVSPISQTSQDNSGASHPGFSRPSGPIKVVSTGTGK